MARSKPPKQSFAKDSRTTGQHGASLVSAFHSTLPLFASAILSLDAWHLRIADTTTAAVRNEYALDKGLACCCLAWGTIAQSKRSDKSKKKRKVDDDAPVGVVAAGTNDGSVYIYNPSEDEPIATLQGSHTGEVLAITFTSSSIWSAGSDGKVVEWDIASQKALQSITVDAAQSLKALAVSTPNLLAASYTISHYVLPSNEPQNTYTNHTSPIHSLLLSADQHFVSAAEDDRYINVFTLGNAVQDKALIAEADVRKVAINAKTLCALTADGAVEIFDDIFTGSTPAATGKRRKSQVTKSTSIIKLQRPDGAAIELADICIRSNQLVIVAWSEGARIVFETMQIRDDSDTLVESTEIVRSKLPALGALNGTKDKTGTAYQETNAEIIAGNDMRDLEMTDATPQTNGHANGAVEDSDEEGEPAEEPTLAERLHAMEVNAATPAKTNTTSKAVLKMPSASSLSTVLTQALKSNDTALLESCLHHSDSKIILTTVRRLDATLAVTLLEQLASRIARRPGRSADLGIWVRWTIVVHGGYLASLPSLVRVLNSLHSVLATRAASLPRLLALQGRLDMVNAQIELRREGGLRAQAAEDPSDVEYVEGESDISDEEEIGIDDASQLGGIDSSDDEDGNASDADSDVLGDDDGDFSDDSGDGNEFAELDAQMEMMQDDDEDDDEEEEVDGPSDDDPDA